MDEFYNQTNFNRSSDFNNSSPGDSPENINGVRAVVRLLELIIICTGLPSTLLAIVAVCCLIQKDHIAPVYIINLHISDLIQLCCLTSLAMGGDPKIIECIYLFGEMASVGFMVCISLERYLVIVKPLWYRLRRDINTLVVVCLVVWMLPLIYAIPFYCDVNDEVREAIYAIYHLIPLPLFSFFLFGTIEALSAALSVPADEKRRIVAILVTVLLIYTLLFVPSIVWSLVEKARDSYIYSKVVFIFLNLSPLADLTMYFFIRKGIIDKLLKSLPCCKTSADLQTNSAYIDDGSVSFDEPV